MVFSLAGSLQMPGIPTIPAIEYSMDAMASRIVNWLIGKSPQPGGSSLRGDLIIPERWGNKTVAAGNGFPDNSARYLPGQRILSMAAR